MWLCYDHFSPVSKVLNLYDNIVINFAKEDKMYMFAKRCSKGDQWILRQTYAASLAFTSLVVTELSWKEMRRFAWGVIAPLLMVIFLNNVAVLRTLYIDALIVITKGRPLWSPIFSAINRSSFHRCGFETSSCHMCDKSSSACEWSGGFARGSPVFAPPNDWLGSKWMK